MEVVLSQFIASLSASGLMSADDIEAFVERLPSEKKPDDGAALAKELVRQKRLTKFQAQAVYQGKTKLILGDYVVLDQIGQGGMGQVFKAEHRTMERVVALKTLTAVATKSEHAVKRFHREVKVAARLSHPNIVTAYDAGEAHGLHYLVMEYVDGSDLASSVRQHGRSSVSTALDYISQAARGLEYAHSEGVIHRDIKPSNLLLDKKGNVKVLDMGLARLNQAIGPEDQTAEETLTGTGQVMGTIDFLPPEQAENTKAADERSDIYSLGCTLYYLLTGRAIYSGDTTVMKILAHRETAIPSLRVELPKIPQQLDAVYQKMVAKKPDDRYGSMAEVIAELEKIASPQSEEYAETASFSPMPKIKTEGDDHTLDLNLPVVSPVDEFRKGRPKKAKKKKVKVKQKQIIFGSAALGFVLLLLGVVFMLRTPDGTLVVEISEDDVVVQVLDEQDKVEITRKGEKGKLSISVDPGKHKLKVEKDGFSLFTENFEIEKGGEKVIAAKLERVKVARKKDAAKSGPAVRATSSDDNYALEFDGKRSGVEAPTLRFDGQHPFTIEAIFRSHGVDPTIDPSGYQPHIAGWSVASLNETQLERVLMYGGDAEAKHHLVSARFEINRPVHVAGIWDGKRLFLFVNGKRSSQMAPIESYLADQDKRFSIGMQMTSGDRQFPGFHGIIDEVRISNIARYTEDFTPKKRFESDEHTMALYHFDDGSGDVLKNSSGNDHHGQIVGAKWVKVDDELRVVEEGAAEMSAPSPAIAPFTPEESKQHQQTWAKHLGTEVETTNSIGMEMVLIPPCEFKMGSTEEEIAKLLKEAEESGSLDELLAEHIRSEGPQHKVTLTKPFYLAAHEVTRQQFSKFVEETGYETDAEKDDEGGYGFIDGKRVQDPKFIWDADLDFEQTDEHPVVIVSWNDATAFCEWLSTKEGENYRLPTEAQWEFACRAGTTSRYSFGNDEALLEMYAWYLNKGGNGTKPVGQKKANGFGLFDLHGNVQEWCQDKYGPYSEKPSVDPLGVTDKRTRSLRGGSFFAQPSLVRSVCRKLYQPVYRAADIGFRPARTCP